MVPFISAKVFNFLYHLNKLPNLLFFLFNEINNRRITQTKKSNSCIVKYKPCTYLPQLVNQSDAKVVLALLQHPFILTLIHSSFLIYCRSLCFLLVLYFMRDVFWTKKTLTAFQEATFSVAFQQSKKWRTSSYLKWKEKVFYWQLDATTTLFVTSQKKKKVNLFSLF